MTDQTPRPLEVLYLINGLGTGGAERSLADLLPLLSERGVNIQIACLFPRGAGVQAEVAADTRIWFLRSQSWPGRVRELRGLLRRLRPSILHTTLFEADLVGRLAAAGTRIPVLTSLVNTSYDRSRLRNDRNLSPRRLAAARLLDGFTARHLTAHFHAITRAVKESAMEKLHIRGDDITVISRARDLARLGTQSEQRRSDVRDALGLAATDEVVLALGRQEYQKGHIYLIEATARLRSGRPNLKVLIAGREGQATSDLGKAVALLGVGDAVAFLGHRDDVGDLLAAADVFCFPSVYEGLGGSVIEAMAMGLPVVASDLPALREVVGDAGVLVPAESPGSLAAAIAELLDDRAVAADLAAKAKRRISDLFDLEGVADQTAHLYRHIADDRV